MKRFRSIISVFLLCFSVLFSSFAIAEQTVHVKKVLDGDTVELSDGRRVRYLGINTPEWQEPFSIKAKRLNKSLVEGRTVTLEFDKRRTDGYKRLLAYVFIDGVMVNEKILEKGFAHVFFFPPNLKYNDKFLDVQKKAKIERKGMWAKYDESVTLKITQLKPAENMKGSWTSAYIRVVNLSVERINLKGYKISNSSGQHYVFPDFNLEPGFTAVISDKKGKDGYSYSGQLRLHWKDLSTAWKKTKGRAILKNPYNKVIGVYRYKGRRIFYGTSE